MFLNFKSFLFHYVSFTLKHKKTKSLIISTIVISIGIAFLDKYSKLKFLVYNVAKIH